MHVNIVVKTLDNVVVPSTLFMFLFQNSSIYVEYDFFDHADLPLDIIL